MKRLTAMTVIPALVSLGSIGCRPAPPPHTQPQFDIQHGQHPQYQQPYQPQYQQQPQYEQQQPEYQQPPAGTPQQESGAN